MITRIKEFSEKMDKFGKEDIDINNDGKVDKSDFFLLGRRRKIKKAIKDKKMKKENATDANNYQKAMQIFYDFNTLTELMDEGYLNNDTLEFKEGLSLDDINSGLTSNGNEDWTFESIEDYNRFIERCKKHLAIA